MLQIDVLIGSFFYIGVNFEVEQMFLVVVGLFSDCELSGEHPCIIWLLRYLKLYLLYVTVIDFNSIGFGLRLEGD